MTRLASLVVLLAIIVATSILFWRVMSSFFVPLFLSLLLVVMFRPVFEWLLLRLQRPRLSAGLTVALITLLVLLPAVWVVSVGVSQGVSIFTGAEITTDFNPRLEGLRKKLNLDLPPAYTEFREAAHALEDLSGLAGETLAAPPLAEIQAVRDQLAAVRELMMEKGSKASTVSMELAMESIDEALASGEDPAVQDAALKKSWGAVQHYRIQLLGGPIRAWLTETVNPSEEHLRQLQSQGFAYLRHWLLSISSTTLSLVAKTVLGGVIVVISLYFFLLDGPAMTKTVMWLSPLDDRHEEELLGEFTKVSRAVVVATLLSAIVQAILASIGFWVAGLPSVVLLMLLTAIFAMVPFFGAAAVWVPASIYLYVGDGRLGAAIGLAIYGALIVSTSDNLIKPWVLHGQSNIHPLFALLSVLGGVQTLGPMGILVGPMVVAFMQTLLKILHRELTSMDRREGEHPGGSLLAPGS